MLQTTEPPGQGRIFIINLIKCHDWGTKYVAYGLGNNINDFVKTQTELIAPRGMVSFSI